MKSYEPDPHILHSLETVVRMTGSSRRKIVFYCRSGLVESAPDMQFDDDSVRLLQQIERLRRDHRMNWAAIRMIAELLREVEALRDELRFRR
ncbi:DNA-binding transcriptional MerR regulator [Haloferula luteola]|uniref:DNA-binding transcriptional MerR regulator n=1 Tax=Haloferula luteola TaxID=595692 RepID=A0A840V8P6_9BACT|nr:chaperone modulator CbpM [Haloferula luteola]MBB5350330.1 DNA-binding transcriptional MerR regulator [Haloferula luteola]